jgi:hypothetical protein
VFSNGATLYPRVLISVEPVPKGPLGLPAGKTAIRSARSSLEKPPWKNLKAIEKTLDERFLRPMYVGTSIAPFRALDPDLAVVPRISGVLVSGNDPRIEADPGLAAWIREAERLWDENKPSGSTLSFLEQIDYRRKLSDQFPIAQHRVVYTKSGANLVAARLTDIEAVIDHKLYWAPVGSIEEGQYLVSILNSKILQDKVRPLQSRGQFGPRDFDKYVFAVPFPLFDRDNPLHVAMADLGARAEKVAADVMIPAGTGFKKARTMVDKALDEDGVSEEIEAAVDDLLDMVPPPDPTAVGVD